MYDIVTTICWFSDMPAFLGPVFGRLNSWHSSEKYGSSIKKLTGTKLERNGPDEGCKSSPLSRAGIPIGP